MSDKINDGGPAFPALNVCGQSNGMSLRDYFAGQAMLGLLTQHIKHSDKEMHGDIQYDHVLEPVFTPSWITIGGEPMESESIYSCACDAYAIADAMLAARKEAPRE